MKKKTLFLLIHFFLLNRSQCRDRAFLLTLIFILFMFLYSGVCVDLQGQPSCSIDDVTVSCGEQGRRKRGTSAGANSELKITFKLKVSSTSKVKEVQFN